jgi:hypothetical protein
MTIAAKSWRCHPASHVRPGSDAEKQPPSDDLWNQRGHRRPVQASLADYPLSAYMASEFVKRWPEQPGRYPSPWREVRGDRLEEARSGFVDPHPARCNSEVNLWRSWIGDRQHRQSGSKLPITVTGGSICWCGWRPTIIALRRQPRSAVNARHRFDRRLHWWVYYMPNLARIVEGFFA